MRMTRLSLTDQTRRNLFQQSFPRGRSQSTGACVIAAQAHRRGQHRLITDGYTMLTEIPSLDCEAIRGTFRQWQAKQEPVAAQLSDSLVALSAYQTHLDAWQQQLAREREELRTAREQLDQDRSTSKESQARFTEVNAELSGAREKIAALTASLLSRTEELRTLDNRRSELVTDLEVARAREKELIATLEEMRHTRDQERAQWASESRHLRELLERSLEGVEGESQAATAEHGRIIQGSNFANGGRAADNPVFASVMEQFGKLRQQKASDRPAVKKVR
jgi:septal ring factor EnvC (AmiA/AmiB activator)